MCLYRVQYATDELREKHAGQTITAWKVVLYYPESSSLWSIHYTHEWRVGVNQAKGIPYDVQAPPNFIYEGIHVYKHLTDAIKHQQIHHNYRVMAVQCNIDDLVAAGEHDGACQEHMVFTKVTVTEEEYEKTVN